jgi:hypothetical protein
MCFRSKVRRATSKWAGPHRRSLYDAAAASRADISIAVPTDQPQFRLMSLLKRSGRPEAADSCGIARQNVPKLGANSPCGYELSH